MSRADDIALWHEVNRTIIGLPSVAEPAGAESAIAA